MKKIIYALLISLSTLSAVAQSFDLYALAGPVVSQIDGDRLGGYNKLGAVIGMGVSHSFTNKWSGLLEFDYISKGKGSFEEATGGTFETALHYIELPILAQYHLNSKISIASGFSFATLMKYQFYEDGYPSSHNSWTPRNFDFDWLLEGSYYLNNQISINLRFSNSIIPMGLTSDVADPYRPNIFKHPYGMYNRSLALMGQYHF